MAYALRTKPCVDCGEPVTKRAKPSIPWRCTEHTIARMVDAIGQMRDRSGPLWDQWQAAMRDADARGAFVAGARSAQPRGGTPPHP